METLVTVYQAVTMCPVSKFIHNHFWSSGHPREAGVIMTHVTEMGTGGSERPRLPQPLSAGRRVSDPSPASSPPAQEVLPCIYPTVKQRNRIVK